MARDGFILIPVMVARLQGVVDVEHRQPAMTDPPQANLQNSPYTTPRRPVQLRRIGRSASVGTGVQLPSDWVFSLDRNGCSECVGARRYGEWRRGGSVALGAMTGGLVGMMGVGHVTLLGRIASPVLGGIASLEMLK
jgi:hypothetical protein